jgi:hypothetical protein
VSASASVRTSLPPEGRISARDLARRLGVKSGTLAKWRRTGKGPTEFLHLSGTLVVYDLRAVIEWERRCAEEDLDYPTPPAPSESVTAPDAAERPRVCKSCGRPLDPRMQAEGATPG